MWTQAIARVIETHNRKVNYTKEEDAEYDFAGQSEKAHYCG